MTRHHSLAIALVTALLAAPALPTALAADAPTYAVSGLVVDTDGAPVVGANVFAQSWGNDTKGHAEARTGDDGRFKLQLPGGKAWVEAHHPSGRSSNSAEFYLDGDRDDVKIVLATPPKRDAVIEGVVTDKDGKPVQGAHVVLSGGYGHVGPEPRPMLAEPAAEEDAPSADKRAMTTRPAIWYEDDWQEFTTGADGKYRFETVAGTRAVSAAAKGYAQERREVTAVSGETARADLKLEKAPARDAIVKGRVVDAKTGAPIHGASVSIANVEWGRYEWAQTNADGTFRIETLPGWTHINVHHYGVMVAYAESDAVEPVSSLSRPIHQPGKDYYPYAKALRIQSGENTFDVKLESKPEPTLVVLGYVVDPDTNTGVEGVQVHVWNQDTGDWGSATTDKTGSFRLLVRAGHHQITAWAEGYLGGLAQFVVKDGAAATRVDVEMPKGYPKYSYCDDCDYAVTEAKAVSAPTAMPMASRVASTSGGSGAESPASLQQDGDEARDDTRAASYQGAGGDLPPYDPANKGTTFAQTNSPAKTVPFGAMPLVLGALAAAALVAARLRRD